MTTLTSLPEHIYIFAAILCVLLLSFVIFSLIPSFVVSQQLARVIKKLDMLKGVPDGSLDQIFYGNGVLEHLWREYADSLHTQAGDGESIRFRSTMPAGVVFRPDILVDIPLRSDFFKHLPGLFTGVGIIGTFYGLLVGMRSFVVSDKSIVVRDSLTRLLHGVSEAFFISASAITLAMIVTFVEKLVVTRLNAKVERLVQLLDGLYEGGAGEEYLARLVRASEAAHTDVLSGEVLRQILTELGEKQIAAANAGTLALGNRLALSIEDGLKEPLFEIANSLKLAREDQSDDLRAVLKEVLDEFGAQMKALLGGQDSERLQKQTLEALQATVAQLEILSAEAGSAGKLNMELMTEQFAKANAVAESRQIIMDEKLSEFIEHMRLMASRTQADGQAQLQSALNDMSERMSVVFDGMGAQVISATESTLRHQQDAEAQNRDLVGQFGLQMSDVAEGIRRAVEQMQSSVMVMHNTTGGAMAALGSSADTLHLASSEFARASENVIATLDKSANVAEQLIHAADTVSVASAGLGDLFGDYKSSRDAMLAQMQSLQLLAEQVRRDASMSGDVLEKIESATAKLASAQRDADSYLSKISEVLSVAHQSFSEGMTRTVGEANREFHQALSDSVKLLREGIHELESTLDAVNSL